jgi:hypothetical protein
VTYTTLPQYIYGVASAATETFRTSANEPFNFLNLDPYGQDTWKVNRKLTWTFGIRNTLNSNPVNPHQHIARLSGSFDAISHDVNQPLNGAIQTGLRNVFSSTPSRYCNPEQRSHGNLSPSPCCVLASGFSVTFCPAASPMWSVSIHPTSKLSRADFLVLSAAPRLRREFLTV